MKNLSEEIIGNAVIVRSSKLLNKEASKADEIFIITKEPFTTSLENTNVFINKTKNLCVLRYNQDHLILVEKLPNPLFDGTDFVEYKVLTKNGVGYLLHNKSHEQFTVVA